MKLFELDAQIINFKPAAYNLYKRKLNAYKEQEIIPTELADGDKNIFNHWASLFKNEPEYVDLINAIWTKVVAHNSEQEFLDSEGKEQAIINTLHEETKKFNKNADQYKNITVIRLADQYYKKEHGYDYPHEINFFITISYITNHIIQNALLQQEVTPLEKFVMKYYKNIKDKIDDAVRDYDHYITAFQQQWRQPNKEIFSSLHIMEAARIERDTIKPIFDTLYEWNNYYEKFKYVFA